MDTIPSEQSAKDEDLSPVSRLAHHFADLEELYATAMAEGQVFVALRAKSDLIRLSLQAETVGARRVEPREIDRVAVILSKRMLALGWRPPKENVSRETFHDDDPQATSLDPEPSQHRARDCATCPEGSQNHTSGLYNKPFGEHNVSRETFLNEEEPPSSLATDWPCHS